MNYVYFNINFQMKPLTKVVFIHHWFWVDHEIIFNSKNTCMSKYRLNLIKFTDNFNVETSFIIYHLVDARRN